MKVGFDRKVNKEGKSGKDKFLIRLAAAMKNLGVEIDNKKPDVYLRLSGSEPNKKAKVNVLRLDGLWFNTDQKYKNKNKGIKNAIKKSDALIYQGVFCRDAYRKFLGVKKDEYKIISNGADPNEFYERKPENFFLASCRWRPHKRLKDITKSFLSALKKGLDSDLIVAGEANYKVEHERIKYVGWQDINQLKKLLSKAIASIHLTWLDWCPNAMVEAIVSGCPIIYSNSGGHTELATDNGIGIKDKAWGFKACKLYSPPKIDRKEIANALIEIKNNPIKANGDYLHIKNIANKYIDYFEELVNK